MHEIIALVGYLLHDVASLNVNGSDPKTNASQSLDV